jgi:hypothetical protein
VLSFKPLLVILEGIGGDENQALEMRRLLCWVGRAAAAGKAAGSRPCPASSVLCAWVLDSTASSVRSRGGVGNYGGSEGVQWITYERKGIKRAFFNLYRDSSYFRELHGYDERAFWSGINDDILDYRNKG